MYTYLYIYIIRIRIPNGPVFLDMFCPSGSKAGPSEMARRFFASAEQSRKKNQTYLRIYSIYIYPPSFDAHEIHSDTRLAGFPNTRSDHPWREPAKNGWTNGCGGWPPKYCGWTMCCHVSYLVGGWPTHLEKYINMMEFVSWDDEIPNIWIMTILLDSTGWGPKDS